MKKWTRIVCSVCIASSLVMPTVQAQDTIGDRKVAVATKTKSSVDLKAVKVAAEKGTLPGVSVKVGDTKKTVIATYGKPINKPEWFLGAQYYEYKNFMVAFNDEDKVALVSWNANHIKTKKWSVTFAQVEKALGKATRKEYVENEAEGIANWEMSYKLKQRTLSFEADTKNGAVYAVVVE